MASGDVSVELVDGSDVGALVAQRFRLLKNVGRGGVGVVYTATDEMTGELVALKRLLPHATGDSEARGRFEREYRTLAGLKHPFIIEVFDYGVDENGRPYYTMEYLHGNDLRSLPPTSIERLCRYIRDVASSLALLHARRLLHRDLSPRNVRATAEGRAKLIDFGALAPFGVPRDIIGTPPCVPPEALAGTVLDQRADLFALGALSYFVLTGRHAYPVRNLSELPLAWRQIPPGPRAHREDIPEELDALVMALLSPEALARPATAAEVIERLNAIAKLEPESLDLKNAYLANPVLAGRRDQMKQVATLLSRARKGRGSSVHVRGPPGSGKSRILDELALSAQLRGALVLSMRGGAHRSAYSAIRALARIALDRAPNEAAAAAEACSGALGQEVLELAPRNQAAPQPRDPQERRAQIQAGIGDWFLALAERVPLLAVVVDDMADVDEASAAALVGLSFDAPRHSLIIATSATKEPHGPSAHLIRTLLETSQVLDLPPFSQQDTLDVARSLFGDVPYLRRVAKWVHERSEAHPQSVLEVTQELARRELIRYVDGTWVLPQELPTEGVSPGESRRALGRLGHLDSTTQQLLAALSVHEGPLTLEHCALLQGKGTPPALFEALDLLVSEGLLITTDGRYRFSQEALRKNLYEQLGDGQRRDLHLRLGHHLIQGVDPDDPLSLLDAGWHIMRGGESTRGAELLAQAGQKLVEGGTLLAEATPALEAALKVYRSEKRSVLEELGLLVPLTVAGYMVDRRYADRYGEETFDRLVQLTGLDGARRMRRVLGGKRGLVAGTIAAAGKLAFGRGTRSKDLKRLYVQLTIVSIVLVGVAGLTLDEPRVRHIVESLEPLSSLPDDEVGSLLYGYCHLIHLTQLGMEAECLELGYILAERLSDKSRYRELPDETRASWKGGLLYGLATYECYKNDDSGLRLAEMLETTGLSMHRMFANQVRMVYHAYRGEMSEARTYRERVERHAVEGGTTWQAELILPAVMLVPMSLMEDLVGLKRCAEELEVLSRDTPSLQLYHTLATAMVKQHRGQPDDAVRMLEGVIERMPVGKATAWQASRANLAESYLAAGRIDDAVHTIEETRSHLREKDRPFVVMTFVVERTYARVVEGSGDLDRTVELLDDLVGRHGGGPNPLIAGLVHAERARVATRMNDAEAFSHHFEQAQARLRATKNPVLIVQCERLSRMGAESFGDRVASTNEELGLMVSAVREALSDCSTTQDRAYRGLGLLAAETGATRAVMYMPTDRGLRLVATLNPPSEYRDEQAALETMIHDHQELVRSMTSHDREPESSETASVRSSSSPDDQKAQLARRVLVTATGSRAEVVAAVVLWGDDSVPKLPDPRLLQALASALRPAVTDRSSGQDRTPAAQPS